MRRQLKPLDESVLDQRGRFMPHFPRLLLNGITVLPAVDADWRPIKDRWVLPGCEVATTEQLVARSLANGWTFQIVNNQQELPR